MMACNFYFSTQFCVQGQTDLQTDSKQDYVERLCLEKEKQNSWKQRVSKMKEITKFQ